jgi:hypothetical protein
MGHSAGAHLAALLDADPALLKAAGALPPRGVVSLDSAAMDVPELMSRGSAPLPRLYRDAFGDDPADWAAASPYQRLHAGAPPMLVVCSSRRADSCPQGKALIAKAAGLGVRMELQPEDLNHGQINQTLGLPSDYTAWWTASSPPCCTGTAAALPAQGRAQRTRMPASPSAVRGKPCPRGPPRGRNGNCDGIQQSGQAADILPRPPVHLSSMPIIIGLALVLLSVFGGYIGAHGKLAALWQPYELLIIGGAALGAFIAATPGKVLKTTIKKVLGVVKGPVQAGRLPRRADPAVRTAQQGAPRRLHVAGRTHRERAGKRDVRQVPQGAGRSPPARLHHRLPAPDDRQQHRAAWSWKRCWTWNWKSTTTKRWRRPTR